MARKNLRHILWLTVALLIAISLLPVAVFAAEVRAANPQDLGLTVTITGDGSMSNADGVYTATITKGYKAATIKITNNTDKKMRVSFTYTPSNARGVTLDNVSVNTSGDQTCNKNLAGGASIEIKVNSQRSSAGDAILVLKDFAAEELLPTTSQIAIEGNGSVSVDGVNKANGSSATVLVDGSAFVATPASGYTFLCWANGATNQILSYNATETFSFEANTPVKAIFVNNTVTYFRVGTEAIFSDLQAAIDYVGTANKTIVLVCDGTLSGSYTIPGNVTLVVPFDSNATIYTGNQTATSDAFVTPTPYRTLTLAENCVLTVQGSLHVSAKQSSSAEGSPVGPVGWIRMNKNSRIDVLGGGKLYAYGYITGSSEAKVNIASGGTVYENFQITDWRGGKASAAMAATQSQLNNWAFKLFVGSGLPLNPGAFPISQYYIQNIEVPLTLESGAQETCSTAVSVAGSDMTPMFDFIAKANDSSKNAMFRIADGASVTKWYEGSTDRLHISVSGQVDLDAMVLSLGNVPMIGEISVDSNRFTLPMTSNITVHIPSGSKVVVKQNVCLLPGVEIIIDEGGELEIAEGYNLTAYDATEWLANTYNYGGKWIPIQYAPSKTYKRVEADMKDARIVINGLLDASKGFLHVTAGGADICSTGKGKADLAVGGVSKIVQATQQDTAVTYVDVPVYAPKLKQETGSYLTVEAAAEYNYDHHSCTHGDAATDGLWVSGKHTITETTVDATCTATGTKTETCSCGHVDTSVIAQKEHSYTGAVQSNGNGKDATHSFQCVNGCNQYGGSVKHTWNEGAIAPDATCTETGIKTYTCTVDGCGATYTEVVAAKGHTFGETVAAKDATCLASGNEAYKQCTVCKLYFAADAETNAANGAADATGFAIPQKDHSYTGVANSNGNGKDATHSFKCVNGCNQYGAAVGHSWNEGIASPDADFENAGTMLYTCNTIGCGATYEEEIPVKIAVASVITGVDASVPFETLEEALTHAGDNAITQIKLEKTLETDVTVSQMVVIFKNGFEANLKAGTGFEIMEKTDAWVIFPYDAIGFNAVNLSVEGETILRLMFKVPQRYLKEDTVTVTWTEEGNSEVAEQTITRKLSELEMDEGRVVIEQGIAAGEMTGDVTVVFKQGEKILDIYDYDTPEKEIVRTVQDYCRMALAAEGKEDLKYLVRAMLTYGGYAQQMFGVDTENLAYMILTKTENVEAFYQNATKPDLTCEGDKEAVGVEYSSIRLLLDSKTTMVLYFDLLNETQVENLTVTVTGPSEREVRTQRVGNRLRVDIVDIPVAYWDDFFTVTVKNNTTGNSYAVTANVLCWAVKCVNSTAVTTTAPEKEMARAMFVFNDAANEYFNK